jgi:hypothetical protein
MKIPVVPSFPDGDTSIANLQALTDCVRFLTVSQFHPEWHFYLTAVFHVSGANVWDQIPFTDANVALDTDQVGNAVNTPAAVIRTPGYYSLTGCIPFQTGSTATNFWAGFQFVAGPYNATYSSGTTVNFGIRQGYSVATGGYDESVCCEDIAPYCYAGDSLALICRASLSAGTVDANTESGAAAGRFVCNFTGKLIRLGP